MTNEKSVRFASESEEIDQEGAAAATDVVSKLAQNSELQTLIESQVQEQERELTIQEEYKLWRKNCHYMYDFISETALTWPSLSIQWMPQLTSSAQQAESSAVALDAKLLLSTHTSGEDTDYVKIASTQLPANLLNSTQLSQAPQQQQQQQQQQAVNSKLKITKKLKQESEVNRVRYSPANPDLISTINANGEVFVYNMTTLSTESPIQLKHHKENGYGLSWNYHDAKALLTGSDDCTVALWDVTNNNNNNSNTTPTQVVSTHTDIVNDVKWSPHSPDLFGSVSDDKSFQYFDRRQSLAKPVIKFDAPTGDQINCLAFSTFSTNLFMVGGNDNALTLLDLRVATQSLHQMIGHTESITTIEWSPTHENVIASGSNDRRCILWDINSIGKELAPDDAEDGVAELLFMHGGHTGAINDLSFNQKIPFCIASAASDNIVHIWKVSDKITKGDDNGYDEVDLKALE